ncbi:MAG: hypothetical protein ABIH50_04585 [bacterium]
MLINLGIPPTQQITCHTSNKGSSIFNNSRDKRPLPPAVKAHEVAACPVCEQMKTPVWTWRMTGGKLLSAYRPDRPHLPEQVNIPLSMLHKTNVRDLEPAEFIATLLFARQIINEQIMKVPGSDPVAYIHLGAVGSSIVHPIMVIGSIISTAIYSSRLRFESSAYYWEQQLTPRDIIWESNREIIEGKLSSCLISKIGGNHNINRGWLLHSPFTPLSPFHVRISALQEGTYNLSRLSDDQIVSLGYSIWLALNLLGKLTDAQGYQAFNNFSINFEMLPPGKDRECTKARMYVDIVPQESRWASMEIIGLPITFHPDTVASILREQLPSHETLPIENISQLPDASVTQLSQLDASFDHFGLRPLKRFIRFDAKTDTHWVSTESGDIRIETRYKWIEHPLGSWTTLIVPEGWSSGVSQIDYPSAFRPSEEKCFACDPTNLAYPHYQLEIKPGVKVKLVTNAFGFAGGSKVVDDQPFSGEVEVLLGGDLAELSTYPSHLLAFAPEHIVNLGQIKKEHIRAIMRIWHSAALQLFGKNQNNDRLACFINLGVEAGASLPHFHTQMVEIPANAAGIIENQIALVDAEGRLIIDEKDNPYNRAQGLAINPEKISARDLIGETLENLRQKNLVLFENEDLVVHVESAPRFPYEVVVRAKRPGANQVKYLTPGESSSFAKAMYLVKSAYEKMGVNDLNLMDESAQNNNRRSCWRYGVRFMPRRIGDKVKRIGPLDLKGIWLVPVSPELAWENLNRILQKLEL